MKLRFEIECTPEEAKQLMSVPGFAPIQEQLLARAKTAMEGGMSPPAVDALVKSWAPMGEAGLSIIRQLMKPAAPIAPPAAGAPTPTRTD